MEQKKLSRTELMKIGSRELAYLGDSIYEACIRKRLMLDGVPEIRHMNERSEDYVSASSQAAILDEIKDELTDEEKAVARRGRNSRIKHPAKSASIQEYRKATALESVFGYLSVTGNDERIEELADIVFAAGKRGKR